MIGDKYDVVLLTGEHVYWSTHCRHERHDACTAVEIAPGVPRIPAECKTCAAPCICKCHEEVRSDPADPARRGRAEAGRR